MSSKIAFYAPLKSPEHPTPSGDREMARGLIKALGMNDHGWSVELASTLRLYDGKGDKVLQNDLITKAKQEANRLIKNQQSDHWRIWVTYHNYYKAPDLIGPIVSKALNIPYIQIEATRAKKRLNGPWASFAQLSEQACDHADAIFYFTNNDREALEKYRTASQKLIHLPPFLAQSDLTVSNRIKPKKNTILTVGMMRKGAKVKSYKLIAEALGLLKSKNWRMDIIGDGSEKQQVSDIFKYFCDHITFHGKLSISEIRKFYTTSTLLLWPGVDEAFGMVYLEAQAAGTPVVAQDRPGVCDVITNLTPLNSINNIDEMAKSIDRLFENNDHWSEQSQASLKFIAQNHLIKSASNTLNMPINTLIKLDK